MVMCLGLTGCLKSIDVNDPTTQFTTKTAIQLTTAAYLDKNNSPESIGKLGMVIETILFYLDGEEIKAVTFQDLNLELKRYIMSLDGLNSVEQMSLINLGDLIIAEAIAWSNVDVTEYIDEESIKIIKFCVKSMDDVVVLYKG